MIAALAIDQNSVESTISQKFARGNYVAILNKENNDVELIQNPFINETRQAGNKLFSLLTQKYKADTFIAYELGYRTQQLATLHKVQLIILQSRQNKLKHIMELMRIDNRRL